MVVNSTLFFAIFSRLCGKFLKLTVSKLNYSNWCLLRELEERFLIILTTVMGNSASKDQVLSLSLYICLFHLGKMGGTTTAV